jgi:lysyl-tRNA synthetase class 2
MANLKELRDERLRKLQELKKLGINAYPAKSNRTHRLSEISTKFDDLDSSEVSVTGRIQSIRKFGKIAFITIRDQSGSLQLFLSKESVELLDASDSRIGFQQIPLIDPGDFIEARGNVIKTQTGEVSVDVKVLRLLTKSLRPMPLEREGFRNKEERLRRRYVDMNVNLNVRDRFVRRSKFWQATRDFLNLHGFVEVNIPVLEHTTGGADANPFVTHMDALNQDFYLRISHELPLKRLVGAGFEKVYDIGPRFRNENYSDEHLPEHVAMEWYWAYADWRDGMNVMTEMYRAVLQAAFGTLQFKVNGFEIDMAKEWEEWDYAETIKKHYDIDVYDCSLDRVKKALADNKLEVEQTENKARGIDKLWKNIRKDVAGPIWLINTPLFISPLAKTNRDSPNTVERFQPVIAGTELGNGWSELNDPVDQLQRFLEQQNMRDSGDDEAQMLDIDYVEMLEYGMPPACGWGYSERVFWIFEGVSAREGVPFPQLRQEIDEVTKSIYPELTFGGMNTTSTAKTKNLNDLPLSAAEQGTKKLYLDDFSLLGCEAKVISLEDLEEGNYRLVLDQSCLYPGGGGQSFDLGEISWDGGKLALSEVSKDGNGVIFHDGIVEGALPKDGLSVQVTVDAERRLLNSRLHCAGHLIDYALEKVGKSAWEPGRGSHFPGRCYVEYKGEYNPEEADELAKNIEDILDKLVHVGGSIHPSRVQSCEARKHSKYIPQTILDSYQYVHVVQYPNNFEICCGGTHLQDVSQLGHVIITKIKKKGGVIHVSYDVDASTISG